MRTAPRSRSTTPRRRCRERARRRPVAPHGAHRVPRAGRPRRRRRPRARGRPGGATARRRGARALHLQPPRGLRRGRHVPRRRGRRLRGARRPSRASTSTSSPRTSTSTTRRRRRAPLRRGLRPGLDGGRRAADPRPGPRGAARRPGTPDRPGTCSPACCSRPARRQARAHRDRHRPGRALAGRGRARRRCRGVAGPLGGRPGARRRRRRDERAGGGDACSGPASPADPRQPDPRAGPAPGGAGRRARGRHRPSCPPRWPPRTSSSRARAPSGT